MPGDLIQCRKCGGPKHRKRNGRLACRVCARAYSKAWRQRHPEKAREVQLAWQARNHERTRQYNRRATSKWKAKNRDKLRDYWQNRRARMLASFVEPIDRRRVYERDGGMCHLCQNPVPSDHFSIDHIVPLARGGEHSYRNIALAHVDCNARKGARV